MVDGGGPVCVWWTVGGPCVCGGRWGARVCVWWTVGGPCVCVVDGGGPVCVYGGRCGARVCVFGGRWGARVCLVDGVGPMCVWWTVWGPCVCLVDGWSLVPSPQGPSAVLSAQCGGVRGRGVSALALRPALLQATGP